GVAAGYPRHDRLHRNHVPPAARGHGAALDDVVKLSAAGIKLADGQHVRHAEPAEWAVEGRLQRGVAHGHAGPEQVLVDEEGLETDVLEAVVREVDLAAEVGADARAAY